jgi:hypothetical protein
LSESGATQKKKMRSREDEKQEDEKQEDEKQGR